MLFIYLLLIAAFAGLVKGLEFCLERHERTRRGNLAAKHANSATRENSREYDASTRAEVNQASVAQFVTTYKLPDDSADERALCVYYKGGRLYGKVM